MWILLRKKSHLWAIHPSLPCLQSNKIARTVVLYFEAFLLQCLPPHAHAEVMFNYTL